MTAAESPADISQSPIELDNPKIADGAAMWRIARDSQALDLNSSYSYLLWCRDFADTSLVARDRESTGGQPVGFVTGYLRPEQPHTLVIWQIAVDRAHRGRGLAAALLDALAEHLAPRGVRALETTITPDNTASHRLFTSFGARHGAAVRHEVIFPEVLFPDGHQTELLYRIGPLAPTG